MDDLDELDAAARAMEAQITSLHQENERKWAEAHAEEARGAEAHAKLGQKLRAMPHLQLGVLRARQEGDAAETDRSPQYIWL
jgi:hypothetical protein